MCFFYLSMPIDNVLWCTRVGHFNAFKSRTQEKRFLKIILFLIYFIFSRLIHCISFSTFKYISSTFRSITNHLEVGNVEILYLLYMKALLICCGDIEINPGPNQSSSTFCHWNLNGITTHDFIKISLLQEYITDRNFDICLSETFFNYSLDREDDRLKIEGYHLIRSDDPSGKKRRCMYLL